MTLIYIYFENVIIILLLFDSYKSKNLNIKLHTLNNINFIIFAHNLLLTFKRWIYIFIKVFKDQSWENFYNKIDQDLLNGLKEQIYKNLDELVEMVL